MTDIVIVLSTAPADDRAEQWARQLVDERLAACINVLGSCRSVYRWHGEIETAEEVPAILKTTASQADALIARIAALHSYAVPCITVWPVDKLLLSYAEWVEGSVA